MQPPPTTTDEPERMAAVVATGLLDTPSEERFDRLTRLAQRMFDVPIALVTLMDSQRQFFKSARGFEGSEAPRELTFCAHMIADPRAQADAAGAWTMVVPDSHLDARFVDNPFVTGMPNVRFYAGVPLRAKNGQPIGTFCIVDSKPRTPLQAELDSLADLAALAEAEIQRELSTREAARLAAELVRLQQKSSIDTLTRNWTRDAILALLERELATSAARPLTVVLIDIDRFKAINDTWGHPIGDDVLVGVSERIRQAVRPGDAVGRLGGDELVVVLPDCSVTEAFMVAERIRRRVADRPIETRAEPVPVTLSLGLASDTSVTVDALVATADRALYAAKAAGRNTARAS